MSISAIEHATPLATAVTLSDDTLAVDLSDGRSIAVPLAWFPRLSHATPAERANFRLIGKGQGMHWPDVEEDVSVESLLAGRPSVENASSLKRWLATRHSK